MSRSGTLVALSPHLDDAVFSIGAFLHLEARRGTGVRVVTVFANDPAATGPAGSWDAMCGFASAGAAARARRTEDRRACAVIGAEPHWLAYGDESYGRPTDDDDVWRAIQGAVAGCSLLVVPGFPLRQADHAWLAELVLRRRTELPFALGFYAEQPYARAALARGQKGLAPSRLEFDRVPTAASDRLTKLRAAAQYRSQLRALGMSRLVRTFAEEWLRGGELLALPS